MFKRILLSVAVIAALTTFTPAVAGEIMQPPSAAEAQRILDNAKTVDGYEVEIAEKGTWSFVNIRNVRKVDKAGKVAIVSDVLAACWINEKEIAQCVGFRHTLTPRKPSAALQK